VTQEILEDAPAQDPLLDRAVRLFSFLGQAQQLRNSKVHDLESYKRDGAVHWLHELPRHPAVHTALWGGTPEPADPLLSVDRVRRLDPPVPTEELPRWMDGAYDDPKHEPRLRTSITRPTEDAQDSDAAAPAPVTVITLEELPGIRAEFDRYLAAWQAWADADLRDEPVRALYGELFSTYVASTDHPEELELVVGTGLLSWAPDAHARVRRHVVTSAVRITFDDDTGRLTVSVDESTDGAKIELEMIDPGLVGDPRRVNPIRERARSEHIHPLDRDRIGEIARRIVHMLSPDAEYHDEDTPPQTHARPIAAHAPALILRRRSQQGLVEIFRRIVEQIMSAGVVPAGIRPLLDPDQLPSVDLADGAERDDGALVRVDDELFLPLPVNDVQLRILRQVDSHAQTLIQGPPGTGKTHMAAVLISHLLAQGKRILVTAHTDRALKEVREKLPEAIRPLAVSVVGSSREDMSDLRVAVERIASTAAEHDPTASDELAGRLLADIDRLRARRAGLKQQMLDAREREVRVHELPGYAGTVAAIAQQLSAQHPAHAWLAELVDGASDQSPLSAAELAEWRAYLLDERIRADEAETRQQLLPFDSIPDTSRVADLMAAEMLARQNSSTFNSLRTHRAHAAVSHLDPASRHALGQDLRGLRTEIVALAERRERWVGDALYDVRNGRRTIWDSRRTQMAELMEQSAAILASVGLATDVQVDGEPAELISLATDLLTHLGPDGKVKTAPTGEPKIGTFTPRAVKQAVPLLQRVRVDGTAPTTPAQLQVFLHWAESTRVLSALDRAWPASVVIPEEDTLHERRQWHATELFLLDRVLTLGARLEHTGRRLTAAEIPQPDWNNRDDLDSFVRLPAAADAEEASVTATRPLTELCELLAAHERHPDASPVSRALLNAVRERDPHRYAVGHARLTALHRTRETVGRRDELARRLGDRAPSLLAAVSTTAEDARWDARIADFEASWAWMCAAAWITERDKLDVNGLQEQINDIDDRIRGLVQQLTATRAWSHAVAPGRLSRGSRASLEQYAALVRRLGKGTGQYQAQRKAEIREAMDRCRPAVPVWILPIYRIADQLRIQPGMFDVVIVDEASQAGLEATFLQYLAPRIVVIGDDKQVSPSAVGVDQQALRDLGNQYLYDDQFRATWQDPQRSLFDEAKMRFSGMLTLVEHRRCVPEIIGFSNQIAYEPDGVRLIPVRQFGADRLEPIQPVFVNTGYQKGSSTSRTNPPEADAIVAQIEKCLADPRYDGLTFGVISLLGAAQATLIEKKLLGVITPKEWSARELRCGDAADFQGSERDVMFLSMVAAQEDGRRLTALTSATYVQRYNVAASRAKDQMWLFHSIAPGSLTNAEDMRRQLLDYCYGVSRRTATSDDRVVQGVLPEDRLVSPFDSLFEQRVCNRLLDRGFSVVPQYPSLGYRIDLVVTGAKTRLAVECDGDAWHGPDAYERDMARQRELERCGWHFFRVLESEFYLDKGRALEPLWERLDELGIRTADWLSTTDPDVTETDDASDLDGTEIITDATSTGIAANPRLSEPDLMVATLPLPGSEDGRHERQAGRTVHTPDLADETQDTTLADDEAQRDTPLEHRPHRSGLPGYTTYTGILPPVATATQSQIIEGLLEIVAVEGPVVGHRLHAAYVRSSAGHRVGPQISKALNSAVSAAIRKGLLIREDPLAESDIRPCTFRLPEQLTVVLRELGPRTFDQVPPAELACLLEIVASRVGRDDRDAVFRETLTEYDIRRLGSTIRARLQSVWTMIDQDRPGYIRRALG
jgi:very-short-patch-repair endonuclease